MYTPSVITNNTVIIAEGVFFMPKTKFENVIFTVIMAFIMVYAMICYNIALNIGGLQDKVFLMAFGELRIMCPAMSFVATFMAVIPSDSSWGSIFSVIGRIIQTISKPKTEAGIRLIPMLDSVKDAFDMIREEQKEER